MPPMPRRHRFPLALATAAAALSQAVGPAQAHHAMGGATPETLWQAIASGVGHPVIGFDHLAFVVAAGVLAAGVGRRAGALAILAFVATGAAGTLLHLAGVSLGPVELVVALTALGAGAALIAARPSVPAAGLVAGFALAGLFHGHAYAEAVVGAQPGPIGAYLLGLAVTQAAIAALAMAAARRAGRVHPIGPALPRRVAGAAAAVVGLFAAAVALVA